MVFPVTILPKRNSDLGSSSEIGMKNQKSTLLDRKRVDACTSKRLTSKHTFLSLVGQTVVQNRQFSWLCFLVPPAFPIFPSVTICWIRSALQWRDRAGISPVFPIKSLRTPVFLWSCIPHNRIETNKKALLRKRKETSIRHPLPIAREFYRWHQLGSSPDSASPLLRLPDFSVTSWIRSALQWRDRAGISPVFPIKSLRTPNFLLFGC
jgi:hypothetical protein